MKTVLLVAYFFPPDGGPGSQRPAKFCRYLPGLGWNVKVLTRVPPQARGRWDPRDASLLDDLDPSVTVERVAESSTDADWTREVPRREGGRAWLGPAFDAARRIVEAGGVDLVLVTMSPFALSHLGLRLAEVTGVPVVYDLRDPWALDGWQPHRTRWHWQRSFRRMKRTLESAAGVVANTPEAGKAFLASFPGLSEDRLVVIQNGYDAADLESVGPVERRPQDEGRLTIVHTGTLHSRALYPPGGPRSWLKRLLSYAPERIRPTGRTAAHLFGAIRLLRREGHPAGAAARVVLVGTADEFTRRSIEESGVADAVEVTGYLPHHESVRWLLRADALFLPLHGLEGPARSRIVPGKAYEYLGAGRPILGCLPPGDARDMVRASLMGYCADPCDDTAIARQLAQLHDDRAAGRHAALHRLPWVRDYEREALTRRLAEFLDRLRG